MPSDRVCFEIRLGERVVAVRDDELAAIEAARDAARATRCSHEVWLVRALSGAADLRSFQERVFRVLPNGVATAT